MLPDGMADVPWLARLWARFVNRADTYCEQVEGGRYVRRWRPLTYDLVAAHLAGGITLALDTLGVDATARFLVCDCDEEDGLFQLGQVQYVLTRWGLTSILEASRRGGHLWLLCSTPQPAAALRRIGEAAVDAVGLTMEVYPNRDDVSAGAGVSQPLRLPLGIHRGSGQRYPFVDVAGRLLHRAGTTHALAWLLAQPSNTATHISGALHELGAAPLPPAVLPWGIPAPPLSTVAPPPPIKRHVPKRGGAKWGAIAWANRQLLPDLIQRTRADVALRPTRVGFVGWCPFHEDAGGQGAAPSLYVWCDPVYGWHWRCLSQACGAHQGKAKDPFDWVLWCHGGQWHAALAWAKQQMEAGP